MMITSVKNSRIVQARKLSQRKHRLRQNRFLVEGLQLLTMAVEVAAQPDLRSTIKPQEVFYCESLFTSETAPNLLTQLSNLGAKSFPVAPNVINTLSERDTSQGLAVTFDLEALLWTEESLARSVLPLTEKVNQHPFPLILIMDKLQDPGNLGTLIRTADAAGGRAVILLEPCVDPFDPKTVRSSMGSIFTIPCTRTADIESLFTQLVNLGYRLVGADAKRGQMAWDSHVLMGPTALILGNEARGLSPALHQHLHDYVSLPLYGQAESLNVSVAGGILMYEWLQLNT